MSACCSNDSTFPPPPDDEEILDSISNFYITGGEDFLLEFDYQANPGFAPLFFGTGSFSGSFAPIQFNGRTFTAADLVLGDLGISDAGLLEVLLPYYDSQTPPWDTGDYLSSPELYREAFTVIITEGSESGEFRGEFFYVGVGPFEEIPAPPVIALFFIGGLGIWSSTIKARRSARRLS